MQRSLIKFVILLIYFAARIFAEDLLSCCGVIFAFQRFDGLTARPLFSTELRTIVQSVDQGFAVSMRTPHRRPGTLPRPLLLLVVLLPPATPSGCRAAGLSPAGGLVSGQQRNVGRLNT